MQNTCHTDDNSRPLSGLPIGYAPLNPHWEKLVNIVHCQSIIIITSESVTLIFYIPYQYVMFIPYRRKVYCDYYRCSLIDADSKSYTGIYFNCSPYKPCKYASQNSHMEKVICESYLGLYYDCSPIVLYWRNMPLIICEPYNCTHTETYWRKVIFLFTYVYNSMLYVLESRNILKILINTVNRTIHSKLTTSTHV